MILRIKTDNPNLLDVLGKNPDSFNGIQLRTHKNGVAIGRVISQQEYHVVFEDVGRHSYDNDSSNQIDFQSYANPRAALGMISLMLRDLISERETWEAKSVAWRDNKTRGELDACGYQTTITIDHVYIDGINMDRGFVLEKYFDEIETEMMGRNSARLTMSGDCGIFRLINIAAMALMYLAATNKQPWYINDDMAAKYLRIMENIGNVPYFVMYLFARVALRTEKVFDKFKSRMEALFKKNTGLDLKMFYGNTQMMRVSHITDMMVEDGKIRSNVVEIGCGEGEYPRKLCRYMEDDLEWWAVDLDDYGYLNNKIPNYMRSTAEFMFVQDQSLIPVLDNTTVLVVEVMEHMPIGDATDLLVSALAKYEPDRMIITTPNRTFNQWYQFDMLDREFRHDDHDFEMTTEEFEDYITSMIAGVDYTANFFGIGDSIDGEHMSIGVELIKNG